MRVTWLADVLRDAGLTVEEVPGWRGRGRDLTELRGVVCHHTASSPRASDAAVARLLRDGRPDLAGPLCQLGLRRDGVFVLVADGKANHNGLGEWGNQTVGIEAYNDGVGEPWPSRQIDAYQRGCAAICAHLGWDAGRVQGHKETDPGRKIDPAGIDMDGFRLGVTSLLKQPGDDMTRDQEAKVDRLLASNTRIERALKAIAGGLARVEGLAGEDYKAQLIDIAEQRAEGN